MFISCFLRCHFFVFDFLFSDKPKLTSTINKDVINILPNESIKYAKETQTAAFKSPGHHLDDDDDSNNDSNSESKQKKKSKISLAFYFFFI